MTTIVRERQTKKQMLEMSGLSPAELAERLGVKESTVKQGNQLVPDSWYERLGWEVELPPIFNESASGEPSLPPREGRDKEQTPRPPAGARVEMQPQSIRVDYSQLAQWIEGIYRDGSRYAFGPDHQLTVVVNRQAANAGKAWAKYIESNPRLAAWLERMMVGTPAGEVIAVHAAIGFGYFFARDSARRLAQQAAEAERNGDGDPGDYFGSASAPPVPGLG